MSQLKHVDVIYLQSPNLSAQCFNTVGWVSVKVLSQQSELFLNTFGGPPAKPRVRQVHFLAGWLKNHLSQALDSLALVLCIQVVLL